MLPYAIIMLAVLLLGLGVGFAMLLRVQKKYNGGIFS